MRIQAAIVGDGRADFLDERRAGRLDGDAGQGRARRISGRTRNRRLSKYRRREKGDHRQQKYARKESPHYTASTVTVCVSPRAAGPAPGGLQPIPERWRPPESSAIFEVFITAEEIEPCDES